MKNKTIQKAINFAGSQAELCKLINNNLAVGSEDVSQQRISDWLLQKVDVPSKYFNPIVKATNYQVSLIDLACESEKRMSAKGEAA